MGGGGWRPRTCGVPPPPGMFTDCFALLPRKPDQCRMLPFRSPHGAAIERFLGCLDHLFPLHSAGESQTMLHTVRGHMDSEKERKKGGESPHVTEVLNHEYDF